MNLSVGIVGLPNVGKSTLFNALLGRQIANTQNYPFCTIEPNVGIVEVPDSNLSLLENVVQSGKVVPAVIKFVDIAGLVEGASEGEGLGNQFLANIRECHAICHVLRGFTDQNVAMAGSVTPPEDYETIKTELVLKDLETLQHVGSRLKGMLKDKDEIVKKSGVDKLFVALNTGKLACEVALTEKEKLATKDLFLLTSKPFLFVLNVDEKDLGKSVDGFLGKAVVVCAKVEQELSALKPDERKEYLQSLGLENSALEQLIFKAYETLGLMSFYTAGEKEVRAWTIESGASAPQAAGAIHTDFEKGFIRAKVVSLDDFVKYGGWNGAKEAGKIRMEGKSYTMQADDVVEFLFSV